MIDTLISRFLLNQTQSNIHNEDIQVYFQKKFWVKQD